MFDYSKLYNSQHWKNLRNWYWRHHPLCEDCMLAGRTTPGEEVHHLVPISTGKTLEEKYALLLDEDNLRTLCKECHLKIHGKKDRNYLFL